MLKHLRSFVFAMLAAGLLVGSSAWLAQTAITQSSGLAVAENVPTTQWNSLRDGAAGDNLPRGVGAMALYGFDGSNFDRIRGDSTNGIDVNIDGAITPGDATANPTTLNHVQAYGMVFNGTTWDRMPGTTAGLTVSQATSGTSFYAITDTGITTASQNFAFGFTSKKVSITAPSSNTNNICLDWLGATAVCPSADTAGDDVLAPGTAIILDDYAVTSVSAIASSGTETVIIRAWE